IYWGDNDGVANQYNWDNSVNLGTKGKEAFSTDITDLNCGTKYYYRCYGSSLGGNAWAASENFTTLAGGVEQKLIGADEATANSALTAGYVSLTRFQAVASGNVVTVKVKSDRSANVKVAIYNDSFGNPDALLKAVDTTGTLIGVGWTDITIDSTPVISGAYYWLAINSDTTIVCGLASPGGTVRVKAVPYTGFTFPDPAGAGYTSVSGFIGLLAGWTTVTLPAPPAPPVLVTPKKTITFGWNASSGATKYRLQVNTASDFTGTSIFDNAEITATSQDVALFVGTTYYWRVKAGNTGGWSGWSSTGSVTP
ncbi:MAG: hypothetical protein MUP49_07020, partial [Dehalococcoidia bacterium]|nr:hypothetical protein [Dehalococcoidia bacterium]